VPRRSVSTKAIVREVAQHHLVGSLGVVAVGGEAAFGTEDREEHAFTSSRAMVTSVYVSCKKAQGPSCAPAGVTTFFVGYGDRGMGHTQLPD
jgi:hypothetical protein